MEQPSSAFKVPASPATPLQQLSPDRINQQRIPASPSLPNQLSSSDLKLPRQSIDVQSKVAFLNSLNQVGSPSRQQGVSTHAALQRALLGREEAENALRMSNTQLADAEVRQRKMSERLESLLEELQSVKERQVHERQVFEKEVRKARKDAFRAGSALVKSQEDLKESRVETKGVRAELQHERFEKEKSKQEAFERAYTLAGVLEEVEVMREKMRAMEAAREAELVEQQSIILHREEEVGLLAQKRQQEEDEHAARLIEAQNQQAIQEEEQTVQLRQNRFEREMRTEHPVDSGINLPLQKSKRLNRDLRQEATKDEHEQLLSVAAELHWEKKLRVRAEEMVHFLQIECQFNTCACRVAEKNGRRFVHDKMYIEATLVELIDQTEHAEGAEPEEMHSCEEVIPLAEPLQPAEDLFNISRQRCHEDLQSTKDIPVSSPTKASTLPISEVSSPSESSESSASADVETSQIGLFKLSSVKNASSPAIFSAEDMTYQSPLRTMIRPKSACSIPLRDPPTSPPGRSPSASPYPLTPAFKTPQRQGLRALHAQTTTMMIPLRDNDDDVFCPAPGTPGTPVSREAALAQIRARRDRARSVAMSTSKSAPGSARRGLAGGLRDISAPGRF
jgi:hypothetical protein